MKKWSLIFVLMAICSINLAAQEEEVEKPDKNAELMKAVSEVPGLTIDTTFVKKYKVINDYSMLGVQYGVNMATGMMNPTKDFKMNILPVDVGILYTRYCKMFGYMPYFGFQGGVFFTQQAWEFSTDEDTEMPTYNLLGAYKAKMNVIEVPIAAHMHVDFWKMKLIVNIGVYGGYRLDIHRGYNDVQCKPSDERRQYADSFHFNERRFVYGIQGTGGIGFIFDPIEIHITASYKYDLSYIYKPNISSRTFVEGENNSNYYYTWTNMNNIVVGVGVHYQLSRRVGPTRRSLREEARRQVEEMTGTTEVETKRGNKIQEAFLNEKDSSENR